MSVHRSAIATRRSKDLTRQLHQTLDDFRAREPKVSSEEIELALDAVRPGKKRNATSREIALTVVALVVALGIGMLVSARQHGARLPVIPIVAAAVAVIGAVIVLLVRLRDD